MEPRSAGKRRGARVAQGERGGSVGEHGSFAVGFDNHHDAGAATTTLEERLHSSVRECRLKGVSSRVFTNRANEACGTSRSHGGHRGVRGASATSSGDLGGRVGTSSPRLVQLDRNLVNEVAHTDTQRP